MKSSSGLSLIEVVVSIALTSSVLLIAASLFSETTKALLEQSLWQKEQEHKSVLQVELARILRAYDSHPLDFGIKLHKNGVIKYSDGSVHPISQLKTTSRAKSGSDAISVIKTKIDSTLVINTVSNQQVACFLFNQASTALTARSYLAVTTEGTFQVLVRLLKPVSSTSCSQFEITAIKGIFSDALPKELRNFIGALIPVVEEYTLYVDASSQLRIVSHLAGRLLENQPIIRGAKPLKFSLTKIGIQQTFTNQIKLSSGKVAFSELSKIARKPPEEFLALRSKTAIW